MKKTSFYIIHLNLVCLCCLITLAGNANVNAQVYTQTLDYITRHNYPVQEHTVHTSDGYILQIYRIPPTKPEKSTNSINNSSTDSRVVLLQHGFTLSSDIWLLRGPGIDLPFLLADAGYDVWLGNHRGNKYGRRHQAFDVNADPTQFWNFTWHEMGYHDLADTVDYVLATTQAPALHYVGFSQGSLVALVLLTTRPEYAQKLLSLQFMAPSAYMRNVPASLPHWGSQWVSELEQLMQWWMGGHTEALHFARLDWYQRLCARLCSDESWLRTVCLKVYSSLAGPIAEDESYERILPDICGSLPAGVSSKQLLHFLQLFKFDALQQYDYGDSALNRLQYGQDMPPPYNLSNVRNCVTIYYSEGDYMSAAEDVRQLGAALPCAELRLLEHAWNHGDFVWSRQVNALHSQIIDEITNSQRKFMGKIKYPYSYGQKYL